MSKTAIITGASRGIGRACAIELSKQFQHIVLIAKKNAALLSDTKKQVEENGAECLTFLGDVGDYTFTQSMIKEITNTLPNIDLLVNNAGISHIGLLSDMTPTQWNEILQTNLSSVFNCCQPLIPYMVHNKSGCIINISSMWGISGASCEVAYSATKGGVNAFTKALAKELAPSNIRVNALACGVVNTEMNQHLTEHEAKQLCEDIPACRFADPSEIATIVRQLYESPSYLTGEIIKIDGGYL